MESYFFHYRVHASDSFAKYAAAFFNIPQFRATTDSDHKLPVAENILEQIFEAASPNKVWVSDITYIPTEEGWLYLAGHKEHAW